MTATRLTLLVFLFAGCAGNIPDGNDDGGDSGASAPICATLETYTPSTTTPLSFAADIQPLMSRPVVRPGDRMPWLPSRVSGSGEHQVVDVHRRPGGGKAALRGMSVNAPTMANLVPGQVGQSFMAYKLSGTTGLSCVASKCVAGASVGTAMPCGDPMPSTGGTLTDADRIKILDWIAQGAAD